MEEYSNRFKLVRDFLGEIQEEIGERCNVSFSLGPEKTGMLISFQANDEIPENRAIEVNFEARDFKNSGMHERATFQQIVEYSQDYAEKLKNMDEEELEQLDDNSEIVETEDDQIIE